MKLHTFYYNNNGTEPIQKMSKVGDKQKSEIERILYLQILDNAYREHLYAMDTLKTGIGNR